MEAKEIFEIFSEKEIAIILFMYDRLGRKIRTVSETAAYINVPSQKVESLHNRFLDLFENDIQAGLTIRKVRSIFQNKLASRRRMKLYREYLD